MAGIDNNTLLYLRGDSFTDLSLKNNSVTSSSVTIVDDDYVNKCFNFNSSNRHLVLNDVNLFNFGSSNFTIEFYMKLPTGNLNGYHLFGKRTSASSNTSYTCFFDDTNLYFILSIDGTTGIDVTQIPHSTFIRNEWYHIACIRDGNYIKMFINGELSGIKSFTGSIYNSSEKFKIGAVNSTAGGFFKGWLAHFRISNIARYTEDFTPPTQPYNSIDININNKTDDKIDFNISKLGQETINKIEVLVNNKLSNAYDSIGDLTYDIDKSLCVAGVTNNIKIKVTFDNNYTEEKEITYFLPLDELPSTSLPTNATLREVFDRQQQLLLNIGQQKNILKFILESKNVEVSEEENKLSILIDKVNELENNRFYLYKDGNEYENITGGYYIVTSNAGTPSYTSQKTPYLKITNNTKSSTGWYTAFTNNNLIDVSNYNKMRFSIKEYYAGSSAGTYAFYVTRETGANAQDYSIVTGNTTSGVVDVDISNISGLVYLRLRPHCYGSYIVIDKIWLEK